MIADCNVFHYKLHTQVIIAFVSIILLIMICVIMLEGSPYLPLSKYNKVRESTCAHCSLWYKRTDVQPVYPVWQAHLHYTYEWLVWKNTSHRANVPFIASFIKNPPCLIRTHPPHLSCVCLWLRPKVFRLGSIWLCSNAHWVTWKGMIRAALYAL